MFPYPLGFLLAALDVLLIITSEGQDLLVPRYPVWLPIHSKELYSTLLYQNTNPCLWTGALVGRVDQPSLSSPALLASQLSSAL